MASEANSLTLYEIEQDLAAFLDTEEGGVPEEVRAQFAVELAARNEMAVQKRDRVARFRAHLESQAALAHAEAKRLMDRASRYNAALEALDEDVIKRAILSLPRDRDGRPAKLDGQTTTLQLRACPESVKASDEQKIPSAYKIASAKMPAPAWESLVVLAMRQDSVATTTILEKVTRSDLALDKVAIKKAIKSGIEVPGADLATNNFTVEVK
jgi:hypothetical protein